jgi:hypothetical protein
MRLLAVVVFVVSCRIVCCGLVRPWSKEEAQIWRAGAGTTEHGQGQVNSGRQLIHVLRAVGRRSSPLSGWAGSTSCDTRYYTGVRLPGNTR